jgi:putative pyruvate formate lyase activating enzyme
MSLFYEAYQHCTLCPRECRVDRTTGKTGICGESADLRIAAIEAHFGEEPPISGSRGSGTLFFSGCTMLCTFCQNYQISCLHLGHITAVEKAADRILDLAGSQGIHNLNLVTPDHFLPHVIDLVGQLRARGFAVPVVFNSSGFEKVEMLRRAEEYVDIYLPDFKYSDENLAHALSRCRTYPAIALDAVTEMVRQKGFLDHFTEGKTIASKGVLVRHLVLPGQVTNSTEALSMLFAEFGPDLPLSLMSQYHPVRMVKQAELNRPLRREEFYRVYDHALDLGFRHMFVQHMEEDEGHEDPFLPDFNRDRPFKGNVR